MELKLRLSMLVSSPQFHKQTDLSWLIILLQERVARGLKTHHATWEVWLRHLRHAGACCTRLATWRFGLLKRELCRSWMSFECVQLCRMIFVWMCWIFYAWICESFDVRMCLLIPYFGMINKLAEALFTLSGTEAVSFDVLFYIICWRCFDTIASF
jgi:hypothetical protein